MRNIRTVFVILMVFGLFWVAYPPVIVADPIQIHVNNTMPAGGSEEAGITKFKELVEQKSKGQMVVTSFLAGQLGGEVPVLGLMKIGKTEMSLTGGIFLGQFSPEYNALVIPFLFTWEQAIEFMNGPAAKMIQELSLKKGGLVVFGPQYRGPRHMTSNRPIKEAKDVKGVKMRVPQDPVWIRVWQALGALPVAIPAPEIYMAMQTGQIEAHENTLVSPYSRSMWEVQKYIILTSHIYWPWWWVASDAWFRKLTPKQQDIIRGSIADAAKCGEKIEREKDDFYLTELKKKGMAIITPDVDSFKRMARPAILEEVKRLHPDVQKAVIQYVPK